MPNWENYYFSYDAANITSSYSAITETQIRQRYEEWQQGCEQQDRIMEQMIQEDALREEERMEDRRKYPLFYWKESI